MDTSGFTDAFDEWTDATLEWVSENGESLFDYVRLVLEGLYNGILWLLELPPFYLVAVLVALVGWRLVNRWFAVLSGLALVLCYAMGLWPETMSTLALVLTATVLALAIGIPIGIAAGFFTALDRFMEPGLDLIQTLPPYIYLLPAIALLGYGPATALIATVVVAIPLRSA